MRCNILEAVTRSGTLYASFSAGRQQEYQIMRRGIILAAALITLPATGARADDWCGYASHDNAVVECGYTTAQECENAVGKGGICFVDPDTALNFTRPASAVASKIPARG
jgi:hypothetical protein